MTPVERARLKREVSDTRRAHAKASIENFGTDWCVRCDSLISEPRPGKRYCSETCRKRSWQNFSQHPVLVG